MRILFVNQYFPPDATNTAYLLGELCEDLAADHEVWVLAGRPSYNPEAGTHRPSNVWLRTAWSTSFSRSVMAGRLLNYGTYLLSSLLKAAQMPRPDVVVALTDPPVIGAIGLMASRWHRAPFVQVYMDIYPDVAIALKKLHHPQLIRLWRWVNTLVRRHATRVVAIGRDMVEKLVSEGVPREKIAFIPNWAEAITVDHDRVVALRKALGWQDKFAVMHAGNVGLAQNLITLIEAADELRARKDLLFVLLGEGAARESLLREASARGLTNVEFLPHVPKTEAMTIIAAADVHLVSLAPGLRGCVVPSKLYGIMSAGRPFIAAVEEGSEPALIAEEVGCGVRIEPNRPGALAEAVLAIKDSPDRSMGARGQEALRLRYDRRAGTEAYRVLLDEVSRG